MGILILSLGGGLIELSYVYIIAGIIGLLIGLLLLLLKIDKKRGKINFQLWKENYY